MATPRPNHEIWRDVPGWDGRYSISTLGRVRTNYIDYVNHTGHCCRRAICRVRVPRVHPKGYRYIGLNDHQQRAYIGVHKLIALAFIPNPEGKPHVNHLNGDKLDNRIENLEWCTQEENTQHAWRTGLMVNARLTGVKHPKAKLSDDAVRAIRDAVPAFEDNEIKYSLAEQYGVSICTINDILKRRSWTHVT